MRALKLLLAGMVLSSSAQASLFGESISAELVSVGGSLSPETFTVAAGQEATGVLSGVGFHLVGVDFDDTSLSFSVSAGNPFTPDPVVVAESLWHFSLDNPTLAFSNVIETLDNLPSGAVFVGLSNSDRTASFRLNSFGNETGSFTASFDIETVALNANPTPSSVPAPTTPLLMGLSLLAFRAVRKQP